MSFPVGTAAAAELCVCQVCGTLASREVKRCDLCGSPLYLRKPHSLQRCAAYLLTAVMLYLPANLLPIMETEQLGRITGNTIAGGVVLLWHHGSYPIALVIFVASVLVPLAKMLSIACLCWFVRRPGALRSRQLSNLFHLTELVGKWSMVDVFVVALLVALVQLGGLLSVRPGPAALAFAGVVVATMLAARAFDSKLIWDLEAHREQ